MSDLISRAMVHHASLYHCYNDRGCVSCPMYDECEGDVSYLIGSASNVMAEMIHEIKCKAHDAVQVIRCADCAYYGKSPFGHPRIGWCRIDCKHRKPDFFCANADRM